MKKNLIFLIGLSIYISSCESDGIIDESSYNMLNEFCIVKTRRQVFNNEKREVLSEMNDTIDFTVPDYFLSIAFEREYSEGRLNNTEPEKQKFFEKNKEIWKKKVDLNKRLLDSLVAFRDTVFYRENCNPSNWEKNNYTEKDIRFGWPYMQTNVKTAQQINFLQDLNTGKLSDTITFEYYFAEFWKREKKNIEDRIAGQITPSDIGPRVRCSGRVRIISYSSKGGTSERFTSCSAYTNSKSGRCSYH